MLNALFRLTANDYRDVVIGIFKTVVYHLKGGILNYLEQIPAEDSLWDGECFVFDERVSIGHGLTLGSHTLCRACGCPDSACVCDKRLVAEPFRAPQPDQFYDQENLPVSDTPIQRGFW